MADEEYDGEEEVQSEDVQDQEYVGGSFGLDETIDSSAGDDELEPDQHDLDSNNNNAGGGGGRPVVISSGPSGNDSLLLNGSKDSTTFRPPIWQSVGNVSGQAVTFKGKTKTNPKNPSGQQNFVVVVVVVGESIICVTPGQLSPALDFFFFFVFLLAVSCITRKREHLCAIKDQRVRVFWVQRGTTSLPVSFPPLPLSNESSRGTHKGGANGFHREELEEEKKE